MTSLLPAPTRADRARALRAAVDEAHRNGITSVQHMGATTDDLQLFDDARHTGDLDLRVYSSLEVNAADGDAAIEQLAPLSGKYPDDPLFKTGAVSMTLDGSTASGTAALLAPYTETEITGDTVVQADALNRAVRLLDAQGWQVIARASGDRAVGMALDSFQHAARSNPRAERERRHRVDGVELVDARDRSRFKKIGAIASPSPLGDPTTDPFSRLVGVDRAASALPISELLAAKARVVFGSRWPAGPLSPMETIHGFVNRGSADEGSSPAPASLTIEQVVDGMTSGAAYASYDEQRKGTLKAGMLADLVVLSHDIFSAPPSRLRAAQVAVTIFDGRVVYRKGPKTTN